MKTRLPFTMMKKGTVLSFLFSSHWCLAALSLVQKSEPAGLFSQSTDYFDFNDTFLTRTIPETTGGYAFTHWEINGNRTDIPDVSVALQVGGQITGNTLAIAKYINLNEDSDQDGIKDWFEIRTLGSLNYQNGSDDDNDSIPFDQEYKFGLNPNSHDQIYEGGISIRRSKQVFVNLGGARKLQVRSDPPGLVASQSSFPEVNSTYHSPNLNGIQGGYYFSHWEVNGERMSDPSGKGLSKISELMNQDKEVVARFFEQNLDSDNDKIPDWYEWHELGTLDFNNQSNPDEDLYNLEDERKFGLNGNIKDTIKEGGISVRRSGLTKVNLGGGSFVKITSDPPGMLNTQYILQEKNSTYQSVTLNGNNGNFVFSHWEVNGVRQSSASGIALSRVIEKLDTDKTIVGKYFDQSTDLDNDKIPDWYENQQFGDLTLSGNSDPDNDGFDNYQEIKFGLNPIIHNRFLEGGVTLRRATMISYVKDLSDATSSFDSDGDGLSDKEESALGSNASLVDTDADGYSDHDEFLAGSNLLDKNSFPNQSPNAIYLSNNEVMENKPVGTIVGIFSVSDPNPQSLHQVKLLEQNNSISHAPFFIDENNTLRTGSMFDFEKNQTFEITVIAIDEGNLSMQKSFVVKIKNFVEDLDQDGIEDAFDNDIDGDGFSNEEEILYGSDPDDPNSIANSPPANITLSNHIIYENQPPGSFIGKISADDSDANTTLRFSIFDHNNSNSIKSEYFKVDQNGSVRSSIEFDYEQKSKYEILIVALDDYNASSESIFTIQISNEIEDLDKDGIEDAFDSDVDGDGFSNIEEVSFGSDPLDPNSLINKAPDGLLLSNSYIEENSPAGTVVGHLTGQDPDANSPLSYTLFDGNNSFENDNFIVEQKGTLLSKHSFDYEQESKLTIRVRVMDEYNASFERLFVIHVTDVFEEPIDRLPIVQTDDALELDKDIFQITGSIIEPGDFQTYEVGFVFHSDSNRSKTITSDLNQEDFSFKLTLNEFEKGIHHHYQAYAKTSFGTGYGAIKKFILMNNQTVPWWLELSDTSKDGWLVDSWIGNLLPFENHWAFHERLEWIYMNSDQKGGFWIWHKVTGWIWTNPDCWPFVWSHDTANWLYLIPVRSDFLFYDYSIGSLR